MSQIISVKIVSVILLVETNYYVIGKTSPHGKTM